MQARNIDEMLDSFFKAVVREFIERRVRSVTPDDRLAHRMYVHGDNLLVAEDDPPHIVLFYVADEPPSLDDIDEQDDARG